jgi:phosphoenolpyruvate carboxykinase (GTP)
VNRVHGRVPTEETLLGWVPRADQGLNVRGLDLPKESLAEATAIKPDEWKAELKNQEVFFESLGLKAPEALTLQRKLLISRLES